jgi:hypothetical protein
MAKIISYKELEQYAKDMSEAEGGGLLDGKKENHPYIMSLRVNHRMIIASHMALQERNEELRKANFSLVEMVKAVKAAVRLKR